MSSRDYLYAAEDMTRYCANSFFMLEGNIVQVRDVQWADMAGKEKDGKIVWPAIVRMRVKEKGKYLDRAKEFNHVDNIMASLEKIPRCQGYLNFKYTCVYLSRSPERTAIKGLQPTRLVRKTDCGAYSVHEFGALSEHDIAEKLCFEKFPSFSEAFAAVVEERVLGRAWHKNWALVWTGGSGHPTLNYRGQVVGMAHTRNPRNVMLHSKANQLQEAFEESRREDSNNE